MILLNKFFFSGFKGIGNVYHTQYSLFGLVPPLNIGIYIHIISNTVLQYTVML